jgi:hypothetical protein
MIVRAWHAIATVGGADVYREHVTRTVLPALQRIDGYRGAYLLRRDHDSHVRLQVSRSGAHHGSEPEPAVPSHHVALIGQDWQRFLPTTGIAAACPLAKPWQSRRLADERVRSNTPDRRQPTNGDTGFRTASGPLVVRG